MLIESGGSTAVKIRCGDNDFSDDEPDEDDKDDSVPCMHTPDGVASQGQGQQVAAECSLPMHNSNKNRDMHVDEALFESQIHPPMAQSFLPNGY